VSRVYLVREDGDPVEFARRVRAGTECQAAADYVAEMYDAGVITANVAIRTVIVTAQDGREVRYTVTIEWSPKFVAVAQ
jgi:hypothetical protein